MAFLKTETECNCKLCQKIRKSNRERGTDIPSVTELFRQIKNAMSEGTRAIQAKAS